MSMMSCRRVFLLAMAGLAFCAAGQAWAAPTNGFWTLNNNGSWSAPANWSGGAIADGPGATCYFTNNITASRTITLDGAVASRTLGVLTIGDSVSSYYAFNFISTGGGTLTFNNGGSPAQLNQRVNAAAQLFGVPVVLAGSLDVNNAAATLLSLTNGITGTGNLTLAAGGAGGITLSSVAVNPSGSITNSGLGVGATLISGAVGANVTAITESSTGSALTVSGSLAVNSGGTTLANNNSGGAKLLTVSGGVKGTGELVLNNNSAIADGISLVTTAITNSGQIINSGTGSGNTLISASIRPGVTGVVQNSGTSQLSLTGANSFTGGVFIKAGTLHGTLTNSFGASTNLITLGDTAGSANATLSGALAGFTFANPIAVVSGNSGVAAIVGAGSATHWGGLVTLYNHDLTLRNLAGNNFYQDGVIAGNGNLTLYTEGGNQILCKALIDHTGMISNSGPGSATVLISGGVGSNVTTIAEASSSSPLTIDTIALAVNTNGLTLANNVAGGSTLLTVSSGVMGTGNLVLKNNSAIAEGITILTKGITNTGWIVNSGSGSGSVLLSAVIGGTVSRVVQSSATSRLVLSGANLYSGETAIDSGTLQASNGTGSATGTGLVNVNNGGTFQNNGIISGAVNVNSGGTLVGDGVMSGTVTNFDGGVLSPGVDGAPGGTLTMGNLVWNGGGVFKCEVASIANNDLGAGVDYDRILVTNTLTSIPGGDKLIIQMDSLNQTLSFQTNRNYSLKVMTYGSAVNLDMADVTLDTTNFLVGGTWALTNINKSIYVMCLGATSPNKNYWIGTGNWSTDTNWSLGHAPLTGEDVEFDFRDQSSCTANVVNVNLGSLTFAAGYTGTVTCLTKYPEQGSFTNISIAGDCTINGGTLTHLTNSGGAVESDRLSLSVGGNLTVGPGGAINVDQKGFDIGKGPSTGGSASSYSGASHGGLAGMGAASIAVKPVYGSLAYPVNLGSGASARGGGAVFLNVTGTTRVDGVISAKGSFILYTGSAGGSVLIQTAAMEGTGVIDAAGGIGGGTSSAGGGGGGRLAVLLTNSATIGSVTMRAYGGSGYSFRAGSGTIYLQTPGQAEGMGTLIVDGGNLTDFNPVSACTMVDNFNLNQLAGVIIRNRGILGVNTNTTLDFGVAKIQGDGASVVANWRTALAAPAGATIALRGTNGVTFPNPFVISNYSLCLDVPVSVAGNWVVASNGSLSHSGNYNPLPGSEDYRLNLDLTGNLTVEAGGAIEANTKGYYSAKGPAAGMNGQGVPGAGHGGRGGQAATRTPSNSYGSVRTPRTLGSGGGQYTGAAVQRPGGGSIELVVRGTTTVYGAISVRTCIPVESRCAGAAGGSIYLRTRYLQGSGFIDAQGDPSASDTDGPGGGGRIAVVLTESDSFGSVTFSAAGCPPGSQSWQSGAGTLYLEKASQAARGTLLIDNTDRAAVLTNSLTQLPSPAYAPAGELTPVTLMVTNRTHVELSSNLTMKNLYLYTNSVLYLRGYTLTLNSAYHDDWGIPSQVVYEGGQILWVPSSGGSLILIK